MNTSPVSAMHSQTQSAVYTPAASCVNTNSRSLPALTTGIVQLLTVKPNGSGYTLTPNAPVTDLRIDAFTYRVWSFLLACGRPGAVIVDAEIDDIAAVFAVSRDTIEKALKALAQYGYLTRTRLRDPESKQLRHYLYDLSPSVSLLPSTHADFRRYGIVSKEGRSSSQTASKKPCRATPSIHGDKEKGVGCYVYEKHNIDTPTYPVSSPPVCVDEIYTDEEKAAITAMESAGFTKGQAGPMVKKHGVHECTRHIPHIHPSLQGSRRGAWLRKAIEYIGEDGQRGYKHPAKPVNAPSTMPVQHDFSPKPVPTPVITRAPKKKTAPPAPVPVPIAEADPSWEELEEVAAILNAQFADVSVPDDVPALEPDRSTVGLPTRKKEKREPCKPPPACVMTALGTINQLRQNPKPAHLLA